MSMGRIKMGHDAHTHAASTCYSATRKGSDALEMTTPSKANQTRERKYTVWSHSADAGLWHTTPRGPVCGTKSDTDAGNTCTVARGRTGGTEFGIRRGELFYAPRIEQQGASASAGTHQQHPAITCNRKEYEKGYILMDRSILL